MHFYSVSGLSVGSEIALPGLNGIPKNGVAANRGAPDVTIRSGPVPAALENAGASGPTWEIAGKRFLLRVPNIARFLLSDGQDIVFESEPGADAADIPVFILGSVFGILLHQRGQIVLHASAVRVNGKAILFCGKSGAGKSTLAAALAQRGFPLVTDDVCAITGIGAGTPMVHPDGRRLKLWAQAIEKLDLAERRGEAVRNRLEKFYVEPGEQFAGPLPLGAVYALRVAQPPHGAGIERPNAVSAAMLLRRNAYRPLLVNRMRQKADYFRAATTIANGAGIFHLTRSFNFAAMPEVTSWLDIGLMDKTA